MSAPPATRLACAACGAPAETPFTWRCPAAGGDDRDHVMTRTLDCACVRFPTGGDPNPFVRYRELLHGWQVARAAGLSDEALVQRVRRLDARIAEVDGHGFVATPFARNAPLAEHLGLGAGAVWVKDETRNVAGSHKARHLMGLAVDLEVMEALAPGARAAHDRAGLAIASCGNAALAAAVVARAAARPLTAFIPADADPAVVARLESLATRIVACPREPDIAGDPALNALRRAVAEGAIPFCCQGSENGLTIEGGETLAWEMASALAAEGGRLDRLFVQVGGGALIAACIQGLREAAALGVLPGMPRIHAVQAAGVHPLDRAYRRVRGRILARAAHEGAGASADPRQDARFARLIRTLSGGPEVAAALNYARAHRSEFMWPWEGSPGSVARGILDDETYDWHVAVTGMMESEGFPVVVDDDLLREAHGLARSATGMRVDPTGSAGLAGLLELERHGIVEPGERVAVLFTGGDR